MKLFKTQDYINMENPNPGEPYRPVILTEEQNAKDLGGMFGLLVPGSQVPYHYHKKRESIIMIISGEGTEIIEGEEFPIQAGDILHIPAGEKHTTVNRSDKDLRYLEFFTCPPITADFVEVK
ncbi:MAG: cupin domain-containing protein [Deltaproteobacteria bacterium]|nr:MAG: cupin domain-containing protein [Deltaproteobacteria bacterium]